MIILANQEAKMSSSDNSVKQQIFGVERNVFIISALRVMLLPALGVIVLQTLSAFLQDFDQIVFMEFVWWDDLKWNFIPNYLILLLVYLILFFLPYFRISSALLSTLIFIFGLAEHYVILIRRSILYPWDISQAKLVGEIVGGYKLTVDRLVVTAFFFYAGMMVLSLMRKDLTVAIKNRLIIVTVLIVISAVYSYSFVFNNDYQNSLKINYKPFIAISDNTQNGVLLTFAHHLTRMDDNKPSDYSKEAAEKILLEFQNQDSRPVLEGKKPDVILIINEAFADLQSQYSFETDKEVMPFFKSLQGDNVVRKELYVPVWGGSTSNTEAEVLLGISMSFFNQGTYPFVRNIHQNVESFASVMNDGNYRSIAIHPFSPYGWNRNNVFSYMGFSEFYSIGDFEDPALVREYISDRSAYDFVINKYEQQKASSPDVPIFEYLITIQNHGGYVSPNFEPEIDVLLDEEYPQAEQYLTLINESDQALEKLIQYYEQVEDPVVIIFMGDHQPGFTGNFMDYCMENIGDQWLNWYHTPMLIWANYDISQSEIARMEEPYISSNYILPFLSDIIGVKSTPFMNFLRAMHEDLPVINPAAIIDESGSFVGIQSEEMTPENLEWLGKYAIVQYYLLNDA